MDFGSLEQQFEIKIRKGKKKPIEFPSLQGEDDQMTRMRKELYFEQIDQLDQIVSRILEKNNQECVDMVLEFLKFDDVSLIPTAVVQGGHSGSDRTLFYTQFQKSLLNPVCVLDSSIDSVKECIKRINEVFVGKNQFCDYDIQKLVHWYADTKQKKRLVIVIPDFEGFHVDALEPLIRICFARRQQLPISFVLGVATNMNSLHQNLSKSSFTCLNTKLFKLTNSRQCLGEIVTEYFLNSDGIKLGYGPYRALMDRFLERDLSILSFVRGVRYAIMCHFFGNPLSVLLHPQGESLTLDEEHIMNARLLPSFTNHIKLLYGKAKRIQQKAKASDLEKEDAEKDVEEIHNLLGDVAEVETFMKDQVPKIKDYNKRFSIALKLLHQMNSLYKSNEVKKSIFYLYEVALGEDIMENENVKVLLALFTKLDLRTMQGYLESMKAVLEQHKELFTKNKTLAQLSEVLESIDDRLTDQESGEEEQVDSDEDDYVIKHGLKRAQAEIKTHRKTKVAKKAGTVAVEEPSDTFQTSITRFLKRFFGTCLLSYDFMAMHELFYFVDPNTLIPKGFHAEPRAMLFTALDAPHTYLQCKCCKNHQMSNKLEDCSVMYKLYKECGKLINLQDWYDAFRSVIDGDNQRESIELQYTMLTRSRFVKAVTEMQFIGLIKPTGRKKDHVQRLTWGS